MSHLNSALLQDEALLEPGVDNFRFAEINFEQFQKCSQLFVTFFKKVDGKIIYLIVFVSGQ